jgi:chemotaxis protein CheD
MNASQLRPDDIFLQPGEMFFGAAARVRTLLGSCVAITIWHPQRKIGGICHYMLSTRGIRRPASQLSGKYADEAMDIFLNQILSYGTQAEEYEAKLFGGGQMFESSATVTRGQVRSNVSTSNVEAGSRLLKQYNFKIKTKHLGGSGHRQLIFDLATGDVWVRHANKSVTDD